MLEHWADGPMVLLDFETDDKEPTEAHCITAALIHVRPRQDPVYRSWVAKPTRPIPDKPAEIHGYTTERAEAEGDDSARVIEQIHGALMAIWAPDVPLVCQNTPYDPTVLDCELGRHHGATLEIRGPVIDPYLIDRRADKWRKGSRKLEATCAHYGIVLGDAHDCTADALAAGRLAWTLGTRHRPVCRPDGTVDHTPRWPYGRYGPSPEEVAARSVLARGCPRELHDAQARWYPLMCRDLADYFEHDPKAAEKIGAKRDAGEITAEEAEEEIRTLPERAADLRLHADEWPIRARIPAPAVS